MKIYRKESDLSSDICSFLRSNGVFVQRIESGLTGRGIPDIFFASPSEHGWIELKVARTKWDGTAYNIKWRNGQQMWLTKVHRLGVPAYTFVAYNDCFALITMDHIYRRMDRIINYKRALDFKGVFT
jgi:hypothetical protein